MATKFSAAATFLLLVAFGVKANSAPSWAPLAPAAQTGFAAEDIIECTAHGTGTPGTAWNFYASSQKAGGDVNRGTKDDGNYSTAMPQPSSQGDSDIDPSATGNGNHATGNNTIKFWVKDSTTGGFHELIGMRTVVIN